MTYEEHRDIMNSLGLDTYKDTEVADHILRIVRVNETIMTIPLKRENVYRGYTKHMKDFSKETIDILYKSAMELATTPLEDR